MRGRIGGTDAATVHVVPNPKKPGVSSLGVCVCACGLYDLDCLYRRRRLLPTRITHQAHLYFAEAAGVDGGTYPGRRDNLPYMLGYHKAIAAQLSQVADLMRRDQPSSGGEGRLPQAIGFGPGLS